MDLDQYFIVTGSGFFYVFELKNIGWSVLCVDDRLHESAPGFVCSGRSGTGTKHPKSLAYHLPEVGVGSAF
jgi:hypothetical protein